MLALAELPGTAALPQAALGEAQGRSLLCRGVGRSLRREGGSSILPCAETRVSLISLGHGKHRGLEKPEEDSKEKGFTTTLGNSRGTSEPLSMERREWD